jgi:hypothetical protein
VVDVPAEPEVDGQLVLVPDGLLHGDQRLTLPVGDDRSGHLGDGARPGITDSLVPGDQRVPADVLTALPGEELLGERLERLDGMVDGALASAQL